MKRVAPTPGPPLTLRNRHPAWPVDLRLLRRIALAACAERPLHPAPTAPAAAAELAIVLVNARQMTRLNERFLGHDGPTDVLAFSYAAASPARARRRRQLHGDVFICLDEARRQAGEWSTTWPAELVRYLVHGLLHLCGYDDHAPAARRALKRLENRILRRLASRFPFNQLGRAGNVRV